MKVDGAWTVDRLEKEFIPLIRSGNNSIDAILHISEKYNVDIEIIAGVAKRSSVIKDKLREDSVNLHMLKSEEIVI